MPEANVTGPDSAPIPHLAGVSANRGRPTLAEALAAILPESARIRVSPEEFDEDWYLSCYPDAADLVQRGVFGNGYIHYRVVGMRQGRCPKPPAECDENVEIAAHHGTGFFAPQVLAASNLAPRRVLLLGSCVTDCWGFHHGNASGTPADLIYTNNLAGLPERSAEEIAAYDFQVVQLPLRSVLYDDQLWRLGPGDDAAVERSFESSCAKLSTVLADKMLWNERFGLLTFVSSFLVPQQNPLGRLFPRYHLSNPEYFVERLNQELERLTRSYRNAFVLDVDRISASLGRRFIQDDSVNRCSHAAMIPLWWGKPPRLEPLQELTAYYDVRLQEYRDAIWAELLAMFRTVRQADAVKLVIFDLDDTLWNGISGEMKEIVPEAMIEVWPFGVAEALLYLKQRGVLLAIASRNEESRIREIWPQLFGDRLSLDDFAAVRINWRPKAENVREILAAANLLPRSAVFVDDNPRERALMQAAFPDMRVMGRNPYYIRRALLWAPETQVASITAESARRTEMVQAQVCREHERSAMSREAFLEAAAPSVKLFMVDGPGHPSFPRVLELLNKSNQFNTTGKRWSFEELSQHAGSGGALWAFEVTDKYTAYGLVGVVLTRGKSILQWVMSCRVLGYQIENAVMAELIAALRSDGIAPIVGVLTPTEMNFPCRDLFSRCAFQRTGDDWTLAPDTEVPVPGHIRIAAQPPRLP